MLDEFRDAFLARAGDACHKPTTSMARRSNGFDFGVAEGGLSLEDVVWDSELMRRDAAELAREAGERVAAMWIAQKGR